MTSPVSSLPPASPFWREPGKEPVALEEAVRLWSNEAFGILTAVASRYRATVSPGELATRVRDRTGVQTSHPTSAWLSKVLQLVAHRCQATGVPPLTSLVVNPSDGTVGPAYAEVLRVQRKPVGNDVSREREAAIGRLEAYRRFAQDVPADAKPTLPAQLVRTLEKPVRVRTPRAAKVVAPEVPDVPTHRICPTCFLETPVNGECQNCA